VERYLIAAFAEVEPSSPAWRAMARAEVAGAVGEYRFLADSLGSQYGCLYRDFIGDSACRFLFENAEVAVRFGLALLAAWRQTRPSPSAAVPLSLRLGCHFGQCTHLEDASTWIGRPLQLAQAVAAVASADELLITGNVLELIDLPLYRFEEAGNSELKGDYLRQRPLYRVLSFDRTRVDTRPQKERTAEEWFLKGAGLVGTARENSEEEAESYRRALQLRPDYPEAHNNLGVVLRLNGDHEGAAVHYREALRLRPDYPEAHYNYAHLLEAVGSAAGAADHYRQALASRPEYVQAHHAYAALLRARREWGEAEVHYRDALRLRPDYPEAHNDLAVLLEDQERVDEAAEHYRQALRLRPGYAEAHYNFALLLEGTGDIDRAEEHYEQAIQARHDFAQAHNNLAILLQGQGKLTEAMHHYQVAVSLRPGDPEAHYNYALLLRAAGMASKATEHFQTAHDLEPDVPAFRSAIEVPDKATIVAPAPPAEQTRPRHYRRGNAADSTLTRREREIASLVAEGLTNRQIAQRLFISDRTAETHVIHILNKLGFTSRAQVAAWTTSTDLTQTNR
jgi:tetratricopeptide (TPR) repeat protein